MKLVHGPWPLRFASKEDAEKAMADICNARSYSIPMYVSKDGIGILNNDYTNAPFELRLIDNPPQEE